jgi:protein-tyrosine phosphatase
VLEFTCRDRIDVVGWCYASRKAGSMQPKRLFELESIFNLRELGGYATEDGRVTRWGVLLRAGNLDKASLADQSHLIAYGVGHILDLRDPWEQANYPDAFTSHADVLYQNLPIVGDGVLKDEASLRYMEEALRLSDTYWLMMTTCQSQIKSIIEGIANRQAGCSLIHCAVGKDRTGIIAALVLAAVGVPETSIVEDYALTELQIAPVKNRLLREAADTGRDLARLERDISAYPQTMLDIWANLRQHYGGATGYLKAIGVTDQTLQQLRGRLLDIA